MLNFKPRGFFVGGMNTENMRTVADLFKYSLDWEK